MNLQFMKDFLPFEVKEVMGQILSQQNLDFFFGSLAQGVFIRLFPHDDRILKLKKQADVDTICNMASNVENQISKINEQFKTSRVAFLYILIAIQVWKGRVDLNPAPTISIVVIPFLFF
jgi:hypothetical protein